MNKMVFSVLVTGSLALLLNVSDAEASSYTAKPGDSLWKIASSNKVSVTDLKKWNGLTSDVIYANQVLKLTPPSSAKPVNAAKASNPSQISAQSAVYTVTSGDTLSRIAHLHKTTVKELQRLNHLTTHNIFVGQQLQVGASAPAVKPISAPKPTAVPATAPTLAAKSYTVVKGDTLSAIATRHGISIAQLKSWNSLTSEIIRIGQVLTVKAGNAPAKPKPAANSAPVPTSAPAQVPGSYKVATGDTLTAIAIRHGISVNQLMNWNQLSSTNIRVGQVLKVENALVSPQAPTAPISAAAPAGNGTRSNVVSLGLSLVNTPYVWGGSSLKGFDCSGYIYYVYNQAGVSVPRTNTVGFEARSYHIDVPQIGDLVFFSNTYKAGISHMGIYIGDNKFVHAGGDRVQITSLDDVYWGKHFVGFKRLYTMN